MALRAAAPRVLASSSRVSSRIVAAPMRPRAAGRTRAVVVRAQEQQQDASVELQKQLNDVLKAVQTKWEETSDAEKPAAIAIIIGATIAQIAVAATMDAVDRIPLIKDFLEVVGLAVISVYGYRYFTDPAERESVKTTVDNFVKAVTGK